MVLRRVPIAAFIALAALGLASCSSIEVDDQGRWVGGGDTMTTWAHDHVPGAWRRVKEQVVYGDIIDDFGKDTGRDRTVYSATYRGVTEDEFGAFGREELRLEEDLECEPFDPKLATEDEKPSVKSCYLSLYQGAGVLPPEFDLFAAWTLYPNGSTLTQLYLTNDP